MFYQKIVDAAKDLPTICERFAKVQVLPHRRELQDLGLDRRGARRGLAVHRPVLWVVDRRLFAAAAAILSAGIGTSLSTTVAFFATNAVSPCAIEQYNTIQIYA